MPVMVVGADTPLGTRIVEALSETDQEVRAFVSDPSVKPSMKALGIKVATGDVSDASHIEVACTNVFTAVLIADAADDDRERSFATDRTAVLKGWAEAVGAAKVSRVIWVDRYEPPATSITEEALVDASLPAEAVITTVLSLDEAGSIRSRF